MSSPLAYLADLLRDNGWALLLGTTVILTLFAVLVRYSRSLSTKNLLASTAMLAVLAYLLVAIIPMPRFSLGSRGPEPTPAATPELPAQPFPTEELLFASTEPTAPGMVDDASIDLATPVMPSRGERMASTVLTPESFSSTRPAELAASGFDPVLWLAGAFAIGAGTFAVLLLVGGLRLGRLLRQSRSAPNELANLVRLPAGTRLRVVRAPVQPFCCGLLRPTIVLPERLAQPTDETRFILLHERAHLQSGDTRARLLAALLRPLLFWHPLYWWLQRQLRFTSELLADDAAAQGSVADYVRCMMTLSTHQGPATGGALVATIFRRKSELFRRLEMMLQRDEAIVRSHSPWTRWTRTACTFAVVALCAGAFGVDSATAQSPQNPEKAKNEEIRNQVRELKAELNRLRKRIHELRDEGANNQAPKIVYGRLDPATGVVVTTGQPVDPARLPRAVRAGRPVPTSPAEPAPPANSADCESPDTQGPAPTASSNSSQPVRYKVRKGDTLARIASRQLGSVRYVNDIVRANPGMQPNRLRVGQMLNIPVVRRGGASPKIDQDLPAPRPRRVARGGGISSGMPAPSPRRPARSAPPAATSPVEPEPAPRPSRADFGIRVPRAGSGIGPSTSAPGPRGPTTPGPSVGARAPRNPVTPGPRGPSRPNRTGQHPVPPGPTAPRAVRGGFPTPPGPTAPRAVRGGFPTPPGPSTQGPSGQGPSTQGPRASGIGGQGPGVGPSVAGGSAGPSAPRASGGRRGGLVVGRSGGGAGTAPSTRASGNPLRAVNGRRVNSRSYAGRNNDPRVTGKQNASGAADQPRFTTVTGGGSRQPRSTSRRSGSLNDLADLVTRCIELRGDIEIQEVNVRHARSKKEQEIAKIRLRTKQSQYQAIQSMLQQELRAAEQAYAQSKKLHEKGFISASELQATESRIALLTRALK